MPALIIHSHQPLSSAFRYFWMKSVHGFNPQNHCARCLKGFYLKQVGLHMPTGTSIEIAAKPGDLFYLCGVSAPYRWSNNFHLALRVTPDAMASASLYSGGEVQADGFEAICFEASAAKERFPQLGSAFLTCRNFQFAAQVFP